MGGVESKKQIRKLVKAEVVGTQQLQSLWRTCGGNNESISKDQMKVLMKSLTKAMKVKVSEETIDQWIEQCRSSQGKYASNQINFLHFKRLYLATLSTTNQEANLTYSLQIAMDHGLHNVFGVSLCEATINTDPLGISPKILRDICEYIASPAIAATQGLYRVPGRESTMQKLVQQADMGEKIICEEQTPEDLCGLVVKFCRYLPESFLGKEKNEVARILLDYQLGVVQEDKQMEFVQLLSRLPSVNRETLYCIGNHFAAIESYHEQNLMTRKNIEICFQLLGEGVLGLLLDCITNPNIILPSTVKYGVSFEESARRSGSELPSPFTELLPYLNANAHQCDRIYQSKNSSYLKFLSREIIYLLNDDKPLANAIFNAEGLIAVAWAFRTFLQYTTDSIWAHLEDDLLKNLNNLEEFERIFEQLPAIHYACAYALANHINVFVQHSRYTIEDWCGRFPMSNIYKILPVLVRLLFRRG